MFRFPWRPRLAALAVLLGPALLLTANFSAQKPAYALALAASSTTRISLPIEVMGPDGTTQSIPVYVPSTLPVTTLSLQMHGLTYDNKASVQVNKGAWVSLSNSTITVAEPGKSYGGIGGSFSTLKITLPLAAGLVKPGANTINFRFNHTDDVSIGFRVLAFNFLTKQGQAVVPASTFWQDDPNAWTAPRPDAASVAAGKALWHSAALVRSSDDSTSMLATCADCHSEDGRDLKYFGYSNYSIIQRARFHGLSQLQAEQIASYIRKLPVTTYGRPWNPPYQPGPGTDAKPVAQWAAGAGLSAVLDKDSDMLPALFPSGITKDVASADGTLNMRELPITLQLLDWNHWLPRIHPKDAWGDAFVNSNLNKMYSGQGTGSWQWGTIGQKLAAGGNFIQNTQNGLVPWLAVWGDAREEFTYPRSEVAGLPWSTDYANKVYSTSLWKLVKTWEVMQENSLEDKAPQIFGAGAGEARSWLDGGVFTTSPAMTKIPEIPGLLTANNLQYEFLANAWYYTGIVMNSGNRHRQGWSPVDWGYARGRAKDLANQSHVPEMLRLTAMEIKGMQQSDTNGSVDTTLGWFPHWAADPYEFAFNSKVYGFGYVLGDTFSASAAMDASVRAQVVTALTNAWFDKMKQYPAQSYYAAGVANPNETIDGNATLINSTFAMIIPLRSQGVDNTLLNNIADWSKTLWPSVNWNLVKQ